MKVFLVIFRFNHDFLNNTLKKISVPLFVRIQICLFSLSSISILNALVFYLKSNDIEILEKIKINIFGILLAIVVYVILMVPLMLFSKKIYKKFRFARSKSHITEESKGRRSRKSEAG